MAFTGKKHKGSRIITPETVENHDKLYDYLRKIEGMNPNELQRLNSSMFEQMFYHLSHSAQKEILDWAKTIYLKLSWSEEVRKEDNRGNNNV